ncbi:hypothetical protein AAHE18_08G049000 [Arachis hypogaea]
MAQLPHKKLSPLNSFPMPDPFPNRVILELIHKQMVIGVFDGELTFRVGSPKKIINTIHRLRRGKVRKLGYHVLGKHMMFHFPLSLTYQFRFLSESSLVTKGEAKVSSLTPCSNHSSFQK